MRSRAAPRTRARWARSTTSSCPSAFPPSVRGSSGRPPPDWRPGSSSPTEETNMHGDFSLNPLAYRDNVSRVLYEQGRVQLDSDANELTETLLHATRALAFDAIGPHGGIDNSFEITGDGTDFQIPFGHYWVDAIQSLNRPDAHASLTLA